MNSMQRRKFLKLVTAGTCGAAMHQMMSPYNTWVALAQPNALPAIGGNPIMIVLNLAGGCSYNIAPVYDGTYRDRNKNISYGPETSLPISNEQGLHPSLKAFKAVSDEGNLALINLVGYPNPNRSHDESADIWFKGVRAMSPSIGGWGARLTCQMNTIFGGVSLNGSNTLIAGECNPPRAFGSLDQNALGEDALNSVSGDENRIFLRAQRDNMIVDDDQAAEWNKGQIFVRSQIDNLAQSVTTIRTAAAKPLPDITPIAFPNTGFGGTCRDAARLLNAPELGTRFIFLQHGGFDTHANEKPALKSALDEIDAGMTALIATAKALSRWQDVVIVTMSEFCRTFENDSQGTDHGHAAPMIVTGGGVKGGILTPPPTAAETLASDFYRNYHVDFRGVFNQIIAAMGYNPQPVFPEPFQYANFGLF